MVIFEMSKLSISDMSMLTFGELSEKTNRDMSDMPISENAEGSCEER
jgi:hypothetical protein